MKKNNFDLHLPRIILLFITMLFVHQAKAQLNLQWVESIDSCQTNISSQPGCVTSDSAGNVYYINRFFGPTDLDPGPGYAIVTPYTSFYEDLFIQKLDANGHLIWAKTIQGANVKQILFAECDPNGNLLLAGKFNGSMDCNPSPFVSNIITADSAYDCFLMRLDSAGNYEWSKHWSATIQNIKPDPFGNTWVVGNFVGNIDFENGPGVNMLYNGFMGGTSDFFILKMDAVGNINWLKQIGNNSACFRIKMVIDEDGNGYFGGNFFDSLDIDPGPGLNIIVATTSTFTANNSDLFLFKLDSSGHFVWGHKIGDIYYENFYGLRVGKNGYFFCNGDFNGTVDFDPGPGTSILSLPGSTVNFDPFLAKFDTSGNFVWVKDLHDVKGTLSINDQEFLYFTRTFIDTIDVDPGPGSFFISSSSYSQYIVQLDSNGVFHSCDTYQAPGGMPTGATVSTYVSPNGNVIACGFYGGPCDFDPSVGLYTLVGTTPYPAFVVKFSPCTMNGSSQTIKTCNEYNWLGNTYTSSGIYEDTLQNMNGCDSMLQLSLTITHINDSVFTIGATLNTYYVNPGVTYQWINCSNLTAIPGATNASYSPIINGNYAVVIFESGCSDTSACTAVTNVGTIDYLPTDLFSISPNPNHGEFWVHTANPYISDITYSLYDIKGSLISQVHKDRNNDYYSNELLNSNSGLYFLIIQTLGKRFCTQIIKQ